MVGDTAEPEGTPDTSVSVAAPVPLPVGPAVRAVAFDWVYGTEGDGLLIGAVPEGRLLFDVVPVSKGVAVALDNGYGADDDSEDPDDPDHEIVRTEVRDPTEAIVDAVRELEAVKCLPVSRGLPLCPPVLSYFSLTIFSICFSVS